MRRQLADLEREFIRTYLPIGEYGPYPERLRQQFEGVIWRFRMGGQWWEIPKEFGAWSTVHRRFRQWREAGVFEALWRARSRRLRSVVWWICRWSASSVGSTTARAHHDAGMRYDESAVTALE